MNVGKKIHRLIKWTMICLIFSGFISLAVATDPAQFQWVTGVSDTLHRGEELTYRGYSVKAVAFPEPVESDPYKQIPAEPVEAFVGLNISKNGSFLNTTALREGDSYYSPDGELKVTAIQLPSKDSTDWLFESYDPSAEVEIDTRGTPHLEVSIESDDVYASPATDIVATVTLKNTGSADAFNVDMDIKTELAIKRGDLKYHYENIKKGASITETITFSSPPVSEKKFFDILANVSGYDAKEIAYNAKFSKTISVTPEIQQLPSLKKNTNDKMYLKDYTIVSLSLKNNGKYDLKNVSITDSVPKSFKLLSNNSLHWIANIPANGEWDFRYLIKPIEPDSNGIVLPAATVRFFIKNEAYTVKSNQPEIIVYGPSIVLTKESSVTEVRPGDNVTVTITAENTGSTPTDITIKDKLPEGTALISGSTEYKDYLEANKKLSFSYVIKVDSEEPVQLPPALADYYELGSQGEKINTTSQGLEIGIKSAIETPVTPDAEPSDNSSSGNIDVTEESVPESTPEPTVAEPAPEEPIPQEPATNESGSTEFTEMDTFLDIVLGCNDTNGNFSAAYAACNFYGSKG